MIAPTAGNIQPWRFPWSGRSRRESVSRKRCISAGRRAHRSSSSSRWTRGPAPRATAIAASALRDPDRRGRQNILLAAVDRGLASCWIGASTPMRCEKHSVSPRRRAGRDPAGRLLGRVSRSSRTAAAVRGRHLDVEEAPRRGRAWDARASRSSRSSSATAIGARWATHARRWCSASATRMPAWCSSAKRLAATRTSGASRSWAPRASCSTSCSPMPACSATRSTSRTC